MNNPYESGQPDHPPHSAPGGEMPPDTAGEPTSDERTMAMLCHLLAFCGYIIPFGNIIGPLIVWLTKRDESSYVNWHGREALNFQITVTIAVIISALMICIAVGLFLLPVIAVANIVLIIIAAINAHGGTRYRYPVSLRLIS